MNEIDVSTMTKRFGSFVAVDHISVRVPKGSICGFLGPNGAGKTTTIRMLCGLLAPTECIGTVSGLDVMKCSEDIKKRIGYMSQKFSMYPDLTVDENLDFWGSCYGVAGARLRRRKEEIVERLSLRDLRHVPASRLAGGARQRCALACSIVHEPPILFLDEPTSGADPVSRRDFWGLVRELSDDGVTVLITTHYLEEAEYCRRIILISGGRVIAEGSPSELKSAALAEMPGRTEVSLEEVFIYRTEGIYNR